MKITSILNKPIGKFNLFMLMAFLLCISSQQLYASIPYEGATTCTEKIVHPDTDLTGGFEVDKDCKTIFVLPPRRGKVYLSSYVLTGSADLCSSFERNKTHLKTLLEKKSLLEESVLTLGLDPEKLKRLKTQISYAREFIEETENELTKSQKKVGLVARIMFETEWDDIVRLYADLNPGMFVKKVPVAANVLSIRLKEAPGIADFNDNSLANGVYSITIPGLRLATAINLAEYIGIEDVDDNHFLFGNSLSASLELNHFGMCSMRDLFKDNGLRGFTLDEVNREAEKNNINAHMVANLNIWYPVLLLKEYQVKINVKNISSVIAEFLQTKNSFSSKEIVDELEKTNLEQDINITILSEQVGEDSAGEIDDLRVRILDDVVTKLINQFADTQLNSYQLIKLEAPADPHIHVSHQRRLCRTKKRLFSRSTHCWIENYSVKKTVEGKASAVVNRISEFSVLYNEASKNFSTILRNTTLGFTDK